ncbi:hypothetical protein [Streptomyces sp. NBC_01361]|uniref:hypothetical protein n=1 Tax=Streptomyces sp. NBC_01361 TaxID=2903838 RepID=UPI002E37BF1C|nr:hypothetical protein [Streptomyces sp. NBC_01361]
MTEATEVTAGSELSVMPSVPWAAGPRHITNAASSTLSAGQSAAIRVAHHAPRLARCALLPVITGDVKRCL